MVSSASLFINPLAEYFGVTDMFTGNNVNEARIEQFTMEIFITICLILIIQVLPIVLIAVHCNPKRPFVFGLIAFLFPGVYLFQHAIRKYVIAEKGYCGN